MIKWLLLVVCVGLLGSFLYAWSHMEMYCFFYPSIDTVYAPGFSEKKFATLRTGDTAEKVETILGAPLFRRTVKGCDYWWYSDDGKCQGWADFAWLGRWVSITNGVVVEIGSRVFYD
jgi:outer membrane protein assembly factor BamE (lipoprotein component of BamABCDE complex)